MSDSTCPDCGHQHGTVCFSRVDADPTFGTVLCGCTHRGGGDCAECGHRHRAICLHLTNAEGAHGPILCGCTRGPGQ